MPSSWCQSYQIEFFFLSGMIFLWLVPSSLPKSAPTVAASESIHLAAHQSVIPFPSAIYRCLKIFTSGVQNVLWAWLFVLCVRNLGWFPVWFLCLFSWLSIVFSEIFSNTQIQVQQSFYSASLESNSHFHTTSWGTTTACMILIFIGIDALQCLNNFQCFHSFSIKY